MCLVSVVDSPIPEYMLQYDDLCLSGLLELGDLGTSVLWLCETRWMIVFPGATYHLR